MNTTFKSLTRTTLQAILILLCLTRSLQAANVTKLNTTTMNLGAADWSAAPATTDIGEFGSTPSSANLAAMTLGGNLTLGGLQFDGTLLGAVTVANTGGFTLTNGSSGINMSAANQNVTLNCALALGASQTVNVNSGKTLLLGGVVSGTGFGLTKTGSGTLTLGTANTYTGKTVISGGTLQENNAAVFGPNPGSYVADQITISNGATFKIFSSLGSSQANQGITLGAGGGVLQVASGFSYNLDISSSTYQITGIGGLTFNGGGTLQIRGGAATYQGDTLISAGTLVYRFVDNIIPSGAGKGNVTISSGATLQLCSQQATINGLSGGGIVDNTNFTGFATANSILTIGANNATSQFDGVFENTSTAGKTLAITKTGSGTLTLTGVSSYNGATTVSGGKLVGVTGGSSFNSVVTVNNTAGCILGVSIANNTKGWTNAGVTFAGSSAALDFNFGLVAPSTTVAPLQVNGNAAFTGTPTVTVDAGNLPVGTYPLMTWTGTSGTPPTTATLPPNISGSLNVSGNTLQLIVTANKQPLTWTAGTNTWDINTTANWKDAAGATGQYYLETTLPGDAVVFDDSGLGGTVTLNTNVTPASVTANNTNNNYTISGTGAIAGSTGLTKSGAGTLTLATVNTYTGNTIISGGTLQISAVGNLGANPATFTAGAITINNGAALRISGSNPFNSQANQGITLGSGGGVINVASGYTFALDTDTANRITGIGGLTLKGGGLFWMRPPGNTYQGDTVIAEGTLALRFNDNVIPNGASSGNVTVSNGAILQMSGRSDTINGMFGGGSVDNTNITTFNDFNSTLTIGDNNATSLFSGSFKNTSSTGKTLAITKIGSGTLTLTGNSSYAGATAVNAGELIGATGGSSSNSVVTVAGGATNGVQVASNGSQWTCAGLTYSNATYVDFYLAPGAPSTNNALIQVNGNLAFTGTPGVIIRGNVGIPVGTYPLIKYTGTLSGTPPTAALTLPAGVTATIVNNPGNKSIDLNVTIGTQQQLVWAGGNGFWDINNTPNWTNTSGVVVNYLDNDPVTFDDTTPGTSPILVANNSTVSPAGIVVNNPTKDYILSGTGVIGGSGGLTKSGAGKLTLATVNTYTGKTVLAAGTLQISGTSNLGANPGAYTADAITISNGASLKVVGSVYFESAQNGNQGITLGAGGGVIEVDTTNLFALDSLGVNYQITGVGGLTITGGGTFYNRAPGSTYEGDTMIAAGTYAYRYNNDIIPNGVGAGNVIISNGAILQMDGQSDTINGLSGGGSVDNTNFTGYSAYNSTLTIGDNNATSQFDGVFKNTGTNTLAITKIGSGTLTLTGVSSYSGTTTISNGTLLVTGNLGTNDVTVAGGTLGGTGRISGATTVNAGGLLVAGNSGMGTLTFSNSLILNGNSTNKFVVTTGGGASNGVVVTGGTLIPNSSIIEINSAGTQLGVGTNVLFTYAGITGAFTATPVFDTLQTGAATNALIVDSGSQIELVVTNPAAAVSSDASLGNLVVNASVSPTFVPGQTNYYATNFNANPSVTLLATNSSAVATNQLYVGGSPVGSPSTGTLSNIVAVAVGNTVIQVVVTAQDGVTTSTNTVTVTRLASSDASLGNLVVNASVSPTFVPGQTNYYATNFNANPSVTLLVTNSSAVATNQLYVGGSPVGSPSTGTLSNIVAVAVGNTVIQVVVTAQDGVTTSTNTVTVTRLAPALSSTGYLLTLVVSNNLNAVVGLAPGFTTNLPSGPYAATNTLPANQVNVTVTDVDPTATDTLFLNGSYQALLTSGSASGLLGLNPGSNNVTVQVVSQDLSATNTYTLNVVNQPSQTVPHLTNSVSGNNLVLSWPADHLGYRLLMQTNNLNKGVSSNTNDWGTISGSQSVTTTNISIIKTGVTNEYYRLVYP